jgi:hypothetical protein
VNNITSTFLATRPNQDSHEFTIQQTGGPDWFDLANRTNPRITNEGRYARTELWSGELNARWVTPWERFSTVFKFGGKWSEDSRKNGDEGAYDTWTYVGPGGAQVSPTGAIVANTGSFVNYPLRTDWSTGTTNILTVKDLSGTVRPNGILRPDDTELGTVFREHPEYFLLGATPDNYYTSFIANRRDMIRTVSALYGMADFRLTAKLSVRAGVRWEKTESDFREFDPRTKEEIIATGFPFSTSTGRATTIPGLIYQFQSKPMVTRHSQYDNFFPMISAKYQITPNLQFHTGFNKAISRPPVDDLSGAFNINEDASPRPLITAPNPSLLPEYSNNFVARLAYYFEPAGQLSVTATQNDIRNLRELRTGTAEEFGLGNDPVYANYDFRTRFNVPNPVRFRAMEFAYSQTLPFKNEWLRGITVNAAYTRSYASQRRGDLLPHRVATSLGYRYRNFSTRFGFVWRADTDQTSDTYGRYRRHDAKLDWGGEYRTYRSISKAGIFSTMARLGCRACLPSSKAKERCFTITKTTAPIGILA